MPQLRRLSGRQPPHRPRRPGPNDISVLDRGEAGILVTCEDRLHGPFQGVAEVRVSTFDGHDRVQYAPAGSDALPTDLCLDLGDGDDILLVVDGPYPEAPGPHPEIPPRRDWNVSFTSGPGNDTATVSLYRVVGDLTLQGDLGPGNDRFNGLMWPCPHIDPPLPLGSPSDWNWDVSGGRDNDVLHVHMAPEPPGERGMFTAGLDVNFAGDQGDDRCEVIIEEVDLCDGLTFAADGGTGSDHLALVMDRVFADGRVRLDWTTEQGADRVEVALTRSVLQDQFPVFVDTGEGPDSVSMTLRESAIRDQFPVFLDQFPVFVDTGEGPDTVALTLSQTALHDQFPVFVDTGEGADCVGFGMQDLTIDGLVRVVLNTQAADDILQTTIQRVTVNGALSVLADGGTGADAFAFTINWRVAAGALASWSALGGAGADAISCIADWHIAAGGRAESSLSGGDGGDVIRARVQIDPDSRGSVEAAVLGGLGEDDLSLGIFGAEQLALLSALVDGGRGFDIARITGNVLARDCEVVGPHSG